MTNDLTENLFSLIKSLSSSEKRQFSVYVGRVGVNAESKFLNLFKILDRQKFYDEAQVLEKTSISKLQLSNVKTHLYKQILISLRLNPANQSVPVQIREQLDFALILYRKGLYKQSLKILDKVKALAMYYEEKNVAYEILEWEKIIESQYITRSIYNRADNLIQETESLIKLNLIASKLSNLSLEIYGIFLKMGHARTEEESKTIQKKFESGLPEFTFKELGFREKLLLYKAYLWFSFISQDFLSSYKYSLKWIDLFMQSPHMINLHPVSFLKGNNYLLDSLFYMYKVDHFEIVLTNMEQVIKDKKIPDDDNIMALAFLYRYSHKLNLRFMTGNFSDGLELESKILKNIKKYENRLDGHHIMVLYYKLASLHFGNGDNKKCIFYLKKIINNHEQEMREDLMCFSRILNLVAHYEAGMDYHLERLIRSTYKFLIKMDDMHEVQKEMMKFLRNLPDISPLDIKKAFKDLYDTLKTFENHPFERRAFLYLDILSWLKSKIENRPVADIIAEKCETNFR